jgi:hypothetical protein
MIQLLRSNVYHCQNHKENSKEIELKFRPNDPFSHGIVGNVVSTKNLVLKVTRQVKKSNPEEQVGDIKTEILGQIKKTCRFRGKPLATKFSYLFLFLIIHISITRFSRLSISRSAREPHCKS